MRRVYSMSKFKVGNIFIDNTELKNHVHEIYELIAGDNAINRFTPDEMIDYIKVLNEQIAEWQELDEIVKTIEDVHGLSQVKEVE